MGASCSRGGSVPTEGYVVQLRDDSTKPDTKVLFYSKNNTRQFRPGLDDNLNYDSSKPGSVSSKSVKFADEVGGSSKENESSRTTTRPPPRRTSRRSSIFGENAIMYDDDQSGGGGTQSLETTANTFSGTSKESEAALKDYMKKRNEKGEVIDMNSPLACVSTPVTLIGNLFTSGNFCPPPPAPAVEVVGTAPIRPSSSPRSSLPAQAPPTHGLRSSLKTKR